MPEDYRAYLLRRFPYLEKALTRKLKKSAEFRAMGQDFVDAAEALARWEDSLEPGAEKKIKEYQRLVRNLEAEILLELYRNNDP